MKFRNFDYIRHPPPKAKVLRSRRRLPCINACGRTTRSDIAECRWCRRKRVLYGKRMIAKASRSNKKPSHMEGV